MKKYFIAVFALLMVGFVGKTEAIDRYYTSNSTGIQVATPTVSIINGTTVQRAIEWVVTAVYLENGFDDGAHLVLVDSNTTDLVNAGHRFGSVYNANIQASQRLTAPLNFVTSTGTVAGIQGRVEFPRGIPVDNGLAVFVSSGSSANSKKHWTLELTPRSELRR